MQRNQITIRLDKKNLPLGEEDAIYVISSYFHNFEIIDYQVTDTRYNLTVRPTIYEYCDDVKGAIEDLLIDYSNFFDYALFNSNSSVTFAESWLFYAWLNIISAKKQKPNDITILHLDDHADLMSPFVKLVDNTLYDMLTEKKILFSDISTIYDATVSGAITIGSILTMMVYSCKNIRILHLKQNTNKEISKIRKTVFLDEFIRDDDYRVGVELDPVGDLPLSNFYLRTSAWEEIHSSLCCSTELILHIDMDYFNNRYNGSTSWQENCNVHNPNFEEQKIKIDELAKNIKVIHKKYGIDYLLIGMSPAFYPAEFWQTGLKYLMKKLAEAGIDIKILHSLLKDGNYEKS